MERKVYENPVIGDKVVFLKSAAETGGAYTLIEVDLAPGGGNSLHTHSEFTETFTPVAGDLLVYDGKQERILKEGEKATIPLNVLHYFKKPIRQQGEIHRRVAAWPCRV